MARFEIKGKEHELKIDYKAVKYLNGLHSGGTFELIGKALMGDFDTFPHIVHAALFHTGEGHTLTDVEQAIEEAIAAERLDLDSILRISNEVITDNFFYRATATKLLAEDKQARKMLDKLLK